MKKAIILGVIISVILISCGKTTLNPNVDNTVTWLGTYTGAVGNGSSTTINKIVVSRANNTAVQMQLQTLAFGIYITFATVNNAILNTTTTATINENGLIAGYSDTYHFIGSAVLSGSSLTVSGSATSTSHPSDVKYYYFSGSK